MPGNAAMGTLIFHRNKHFKILKIVNLLLLPNYALETTIKISKTVKHAKV